jgi:hypothetical protein
MSWVGFSTVQRLLARQQVTPHPPAASSLGAAGSYGRVVRPIGWNELLGRTVGLKHSYHVHRPIIISLLIRCLAAPVLSGGCVSADQGGIAGDWVAEREQRGDTAVIRTVAGSVWGDTMVLVPDLAIGELEGRSPYVFGRLSGLDVDSDGRIIVLDAQAREMRIFSAEGEHLKTIGREGDGPGEFRRPDHLRVTSDGRMVVRDQAARFAVFSAEGRYLAGWPRASGFSTGAPFFLDAQDRVVNPSLSDRLVVYDLSGRATDTLPIPSRGFSPPQLNVVMTHGRASYSILYMPEEHWSVTRDGRFLFGTSDRYAVERWEGDGRVTRIERAAQAVPVDEAEAARAREQITRAIHRTNDPNWRWRGPDVPSTKPWFRNLLAGLDGTLWVFRELPSIEEKNPEWDPDQPQRGFPTVWRRPVIADVFEENGRYLGPVKIPHSLNWIYPPAVVSRDRVWAVAMHELVYPQVVRFRIAAR